MSKKKRYKDAHADREASRYDNPVPSRELILELLADQGKPLTAEQVCRALSVTDPEGEVAIERRLRAMLRDGQLVVNRQRRFGLMDRMNLVAGRIQGHRDGFGFVIADSDDQQDLFVSPRQMNSVMDGDRVLVSIAGKNRFGKQEARIVEVEQRAQTELVGRFYREAGIAFLELENRRIQHDVLVTDMNGLEPVPGEHVRARIVHYPGRDRHISVALEEIIASPEDAGMEVEVALRSHDIPWQWPELVDREAEKVPESVPQEACEGRYDLRDLPLVTIDGEDARDFDDAIYVARKPRGGWRLIVAIADVSHYVKPGSALDEEAFKRGTSVYFPNRVVPMLPEVLSNGLCSLNPHVNRLCLFCDLSISASGKVTRYTFREGVMKSRHRLTYTKVGALIEEPESDLAQEVRHDLDDETHDMLWHFYDMFRSLRGQRELRGAIDFETTETRILYDDQKKISDIVPVTRNVAHVMIEEAMLAANICAARLLDKCDLPGVFRNHEPPSAEKLKNLQAFLGGIGLSLQWSEKDGDAQPAVMQKLSQQIAGRSDASVVQTVMLRSMSQARYEPENRGHFGLAYKAYTHFTSPIRRYPDLLVHRAIRYLIRRPDWQQNVENTNDLPALSAEEIFPYDLAWMTQAAEHCSMTERRADDASRDVVQWLKCQYMEQHLGDVFDGVISGVTGFGLFVLLTDLYIEGLVHISSLDSDYYQHDDVNHALVGESSGRTFRLGDPVRVQVAAVQIDDRKIDLLIADTGTRNSKTASRGRKRSSVREALRSGDIPDDGKKPRKKQGASGKKKTAGKGTSSGNKSTARKGPPRGRKAARRRK